MNNIEELLEKAKNASTKTILSGIAAGALLITVLNSFFTVSSGELARAQNTLTGEYTWYMDEGIKFKMPFFSNVIVYPQEITTAVSDNEEICDTASLCTLPKQVSFADTYGVTVEASFRFSLPRTPEQLEAMHDKVKNSTNLIGTVLAPFSQDLINYTSNQFRAEDFMQGGQNEFKARMLDQATNGMLVTKREKILVSTEAADRDSDRDSGVSKIGEQFTYAVTVLEDSNGIPLRNPTSIEAYNISIVQSGINLVDYSPENRLRDFMTDKQDRVRARAKIVEDQENERQQAITSQLRGDRERIEKQNILLQDKDAAKIAGEKAVVQANLQAEREIVEQKKVAELAEIDKARELQQAQADKNIQKAAYDAAKYQAQAIREVGYAEADVEKAKLAAKQSNKDIYLAEINRDIEIQKAVSMEKTKLDAPDTVIINNGASGNSNTLSDLLNVKLANDVTKSNK